MDVNHPTDVNNLNHWLALTVGLVNHLCLDTDQTHVKSASHLLRTIVVRHSTTTTTVVGLSDVLILSATGRIVVLTAHDRTTHALLTNDLVHLLLSIVDPIPALRPVAVVLDAMFVELSVAILAITVHNPVTVGRTSILLLLQLRLIPFRQGSPRPPTPPPPRRDSENDVWVSRTGNREPNNYNRPSSR